MGGPGSMMGGGGMRAWSHPRRAHFLFKHGKSSVDIQCPASANLDDCVNAADKVLNRLAALKRAAAAYTSAHPGSPAGTNPPAPGTPGPSRPPSPAALPGRKLGSFSPPIFQPADAPRSRVTGSRQAAALPPTGKPVQRRPRYRHVAGGATERRKADAFTRGIQSAGRCTSRASQQGARSSPP